jgi:SMI1 / KNR4 family (SUKH-1)
MPVTFEQSHPLASADALDALQQRLGVRFPEEYKRHLAQFNGGHPEPAGFRFVDETGRVDTSIVGWFLAIYDGKYENFESTFRTLKVLRQRMPQELVPIASDQLGNQICMVFSGPDEGKIYLWDHDWEADDGEEPSYANCYPLANSLSEFFDKLFDPEQPVDAAGSQ